MSGTDGLQAHLAAGETRVCRCWRLTRRDGTRYGFTDHDEDVTFDGQVFRADTGMTPGALQQSTGLSVDNVEVLGALADTSLTEADIEAGRLDDAVVESWLVNWANPLDRKLQFHGTIGEITRAGGQFRAELRGLSEPLNQPQGLVFQSACTAVLGDARCRVDVTDPLYTVEAVVRAVRERQYLVLDGLDGFETGWFTHGRVHVLDGDAAGVGGVIRSDDDDQGSRGIALWEPLSAAIAAGDRVRLIAGCDKRAATCKAKFGNFLNYRGFPHIPGEDWQMAVPRRGGKNNGKRLRR